MFGFRYLLETVGFNAAILVCFGLLLREAGNHIEPPRHARFALVRA